MSRRSDLLEFAVLGLLHETPMHGYELRKRLNAAARCLSGPLLRHALPLPARAARRGWIAEAGGPGDPVVATAGSGGLGSSTS